MARSRFARGFGATVFKCECCRRSTRLTGQSSDCKCCFECYELAGCQNSVWDGIPIAEIASERDRLLAIIVARGGDEAAVRGDMPDLWT